MSFLGQFLNFQVWITKLTEYRLFRSTFRPFRSTFRSTFRSIRSTFQSTSEVPSPPVMEPMDAWRCREALQGLRKLSHRIRRPVGVCEGQHFHDYDHDPTEKRKQRKFENLTNNFNFSLILKVLSQITIKSTLFEVFSC